MDRDAREDALFKKALTKLSVLYSHPFTRVFRLTELPPHRYRHLGSSDMPAEAQAARMSIRPYDKRGWCFAETSWALLTKSGRKCIDLGKFTGKKTHWLDIVTECIADLARPPPLLPEAFEEELSKREFTTGKEDHDLCFKLYQEEFYDRFNGANGLVYHNLGWRDEELAALLE
eukprot:1673137-Prymnesium_polylepis.1